MKQLLFILTLLIGTCFATHAKTIKLVPSALDSTRMDTVVISDLQDVNEDQNAAMHNISSDFGDWNSGPPTSVAIVALIICCGLPFFIVAIVLWFRYKNKQAKYKLAAEALAAGEPLPIDMKNNIIYYMGPSPAREGRPIGSAGPTTASRMDKYAPDLLDLGLKGMIGKGKRSQAVIDGIVRNGAVYFAAVGGAGAILSKCIKKSTVIAYDDLGTEAIRELEVENLPVIVVIDSEGNNLYETAIKEYCRV